MHLLTPWFFFAISSQVTALSQESDQLQEAHPDSADEIAAKQDEIVTAWGNLKDKVGYMDLS